MVLLQSFQRCVLPAMLAKELELASGVEGPDRDSGNAR
jgi:hypothetical protein